MKVFIRLFEYKCNRFFLFYLYLNKLLYERYYMKKTKVEIALIKIKKQNSRGFTLPLVLLVMIVLSILSLVVFNLLQANTRQITIQENNLRAHYVARSGIDIAYAALMTDGGSGQRKIHNLITSNATITHNNLNIPQDDPIGDVDIEVSFNNVTREVRINAKSSLKNGVGSSELNLYIYYDESNTDDFSKTRWSRN